MILGLLGGGQLALMLAEAAQKRGHRVRVFVTSADEPTYQYLRGDGEVGALKNHALVQRFVDSVDRVLYESDFLPFAEFAGLSSREKFCPSLECIERISSKIEQKELLKSLRIPTSSFLVFDPSSESQSEWLRRVRDQMGESFVLKWARGGYDGKGVWISGSAHQSAEDFLAEALKRGIQVFAEQKVSFKRELSQIAAYSTKGDWAFYPLVISEQPGGICRRVFGPAEAFGVSASLSRETQGAAKKLGESLGLFGVFALEMFETPDGFLVNEIAPRVHNTGHFSLEACDASQFENHIRAVTGEPLGLTQASNPFFMHNLLGDRDLGKIKDLSMSKAPANWHLKWYDKAELKRGRKMGHINIVNVDPRAISEISAEAERFEKHWFSRIK